MNLSGDRTFAASRETVWAVLNSPEQMAKLMPGVESFDVEDERHWKANMKIPLGLGGLRMSIKFEKTEERAPEFARLRAKGTGVGALLDLNTEFRLSGSDAETTMHWAADVRIAGPVGSMGQRVLQPIVNQQVENVLTALDKQVATSASSASGGLVEERGVETPPQASDVGGMAGAPPVSLAAETHTDPELKDYGPPAVPSPDADPAEQAGSSGAEEGVNPWHPETYSNDPEGPTISTDDKS